MQSNIPYTFPTCSVPHVFVCVCVHVLHLPLLFSSGLYIFPVCTMISIVRYTLQNINKLLEATRLIRAIIPTKNTTCGVCVCIYFETTYKLPVFLQKTGQILRPPYALDKLKVTHKENVLYLLYLNEWDQPLSVFTLVGSELEVSQSLHAPSFSTTHLR